MTEEKKRAFISYSHDSQEHKKWVRMLAEYLQKNGIEVVLDQWDLKLGDDLPTFMEKAIRETDRVIVISTDGYIQKANSGTGGVGYEKTIVTAQLLNSFENRRKFIPIVRNVSNDEKLPSFFGAALYLDLSEGSDTEEQRLQLLKSLHEVSISKPNLGTSPFLPAEAPPKAAPTVPHHTTSPSWNAPNDAAAFSDRFTQAFPGVRGVEWFDEPKSIIERLSILLQPPLHFEEGHLAWWWRGSSNMQIESFKQIEHTHFLMNNDELNIRRIAAINSGIYYRTWIYVETYADPPTGLYSLDRKEKRASDFGYCVEEYGLVDQKMPVTREEFDDGAAIIEGTPHDIRGRVELRVRYITPYNFIIAPNSSPINEKRFDRHLERYLNALLQNENVFEEMHEAISNLPRKH